jgi:hypothetical protein
MTAADPVVAGGNAEVPCLHLHEPHFFARTLSRLDGLRLHVHALHFP